MVTHGPLFTFADGSCLYGQRLVVEVRSVLHLQGVNESYLSSISGHSFQIGAATAAAQAGVEESLIQTLGQWRSSTFLHYIRSSGRELAANSARLLDSTCTV